jgi:hypothetical protein
MRSKSSVWYRTERAAFGKGLGVTSCQCYRHLVNSVLPCKHGIRQIRVDPDCAGVLNHEPRSSTSGLAVLSPGRAGTSSASDPVQVIGVPRPGRDPPAPGSGRAPNNGPGPGPARRPRQGVPPSPPSRRAAVTVVGPRTVGVGSHCDSELTPTYHSHDGSGEELFKLVASLSRQFLRGFGRFPGSGWSGSRAQIPSPCPRGA